MGKSSGATGAAAAVHVNGTVLRDGLELRFSSAKQHYLAAKRELPAGSVVVEVGILQRVRPRLAVLPGLTPMVIWWDDRKCTLQRRWLRTLYRSNATRAWQSCPSNCLRRQFSAQGKPNLHCLAESAVKELASLLGAQSKPQCCAKCLMYACFASADPRQPANLLDAEMQASSAQLAGVAKPGTAATTA